MTFRGTRSKKEFSAHWQYLCGEPDVVAAGSFSGE